MLARVLSRPAGTQQHDAGSFDSRRFFFFFFYNVKSAAGRLERRGRGRVQAVEGQRGVKTGEERGRTASGWRGGTEGEAKHKLSLWGGNLRKSVCGRLHVVGV